MKKVLMRLAICLACLISFGAVQKVYASDSDVSFSQDAQSVSGQIIALSEDAKAYASPDESADVVQSFSKGETVYVLGESDGWYQIFYKGETLYVKNSAITNEDSLESQKQAQELAQEVTEELEEAKKQDVIDTETYERQKISKRNALIWKIVIGVLVAAMLIVSVIIGIKSSKANKESKSTD